MTAAETGHLVLSTLHTIDAGQSINRISASSTRARKNWSASAWPTRLRFVVSQRLAPRPHGGRQLIMEVMGNNLRTKEAIALGEEEGRRNFYDIIEASETFGWFTFDQSIMRAYEDGHDRRGNRHALTPRRKGKIIRQIDLIKKSRGEEKNKVSGLRLDTAASSRY